MVRLLVAVLDANAVPTDADIAVNRNMYRIFFKVDEILRDEEDFNPDDDDLLGEEEDRAEDQDMKEADDSSDEVKRLLIRGDLNIIQISVLGG